MLTKRTAIIALFSGALAKMAHAYDPTWKNQVTNGSAALLTLQSGPHVWTVILDQMAHLDVRLGDEQITITPAEIFAALKGPQTP